MTTWLSPWAAAVEPDNDGDMRLGECPVADAVAAEILRVRFPDGAVPDGERWQKAVAKYGR